VQRKSPSQEMEKKPITLHNQNISTFQFQRPISETPKHCTHGGDGGHKGSTWCYISLLHIPGHRKLVSITTHINYPLSIIQKYQYYLDSLTPYHTVRWVSQFRPYSCDKPIYIQAIAASLILLFIWRIIAIQVFSM
jgi:hypothetical protein